MIFGARVGKNWGLGQGLVGLELVMVSVRVRINCWYSPQWLVGTQLVL